MVRGLLIRQVFLLLDIVLFGAILLTAVLVVTQLFESPKVDAAPPTDMEGLAEEPLIVALRDRKDYNSIMENGLFGDAGRFKADKAPTTVVVEPLKTDVEDTSLNLKLWGTASLSPTSIYASASIEDASGREGSKIFFVGDAVVSDVTLEEVHSRWVILRNNREVPAKLERLRMDEEEDGTVGSMARNTNRPVRPTAAPATTVDLDRGEFIDQLRVNYADLVTKVKPELYRDASGRVAGITAADISDVPLAKQLGLKNGDVLTTVNNEKIDSDQKILEMVQKYGNSNSFRIGILRNGRVENITYNLR